jgi:biopolymer transport protein ExbD
MGYRKPTSRRVAKEMQRVNLIPILDAVFIFIFFLLMSTQFVKIFEISSDIPILSSSPPPKSKKKPLALTITINKGNIEISTGLPSRVRKRVGMIGEDYDLEALHEFLVNLKRSHQDEQTVIFEPIVDLEYEVLVKIMDAVRVFKNTDEPMFKKDEDGIEVQVKKLFSNIIFGNIMS